eukprot:153191_1
MNTSITQKLQQAKQLFNTEQLEQAKHIILQIIESNEYQHNYKLFGKLGDIAIKIQNFEEAEKYYEKSVCMVQNPNANILIKLGNVLNNHLYKYNKAETIYKKCLSIDPNNDECLFDYANLKQKQNDNITARQLYRKCLKINNERACVHYRYAKLLLKYNYNSDIVVIDDKRIGYHLKTAFNLKPNIVKYQHEYAKYLESTNQYQEANQTYKNALNLVNNDIFLLYDYAKFLLNCIKDQHKALLYLEKAANLSNNISTSYINEQYNQLKNKLNISTTRKKDTINSMGITHNETNKNNIKIVIYEFDSVITYWNLWDSIVGDIQNLHKISSADLMGIFGGYDRIDRLHKHFQTILSRNNIKIVILSFNHSEIIINALRRVKLLQYFSLIIGCDNCAFLKQNNSKMYDIMKLKKDNKFHSLGDMIYIDHNIDCIEKVSKKCVTYHLNMKNNAPLRGLTMYDCEYIECIIFNKQYKKQQNKYNEPISLLTINEQLYYGIKREILNLDDDDIMSIASIRWIHKNIHNMNNGDDFLTFALKFHSAVTSQRENKFWNVLHILPDLLLLENSDAKLYCRYAKALSYLRHSEDATHYYDIALNYGPNNYFILLSFGYHLYYTGKYSDAKQTFMKCMKQQRYINNDRSVYAGLARTLERLNELDQAEYYYKLGVSDDIPFKPGIYQPIHYFYGSFLDKHQRYEEAKFHFEICLRVAPSIGANHYAMANVCFELQDFEKYEFHLNKTLEIEPFHSGAIQDWEMYYNNEMNGKLQRKYEETKHETKCDNEKSCYNIEFDRFWFDILDIVNEEYNGYYDRFLEYRINDIRFILFSKGIERDLRNKIGITEMDVIMKIINNYRNECMTFLKWLKKNKFYSSFYDILDANGIYTMESFDYNIDSKLYFEQLICSTNEKRITIEPSLISKFWNTKKDCTNSKLKPKCNRYEQTNE